MMSWSEYPLLRPAFLLIGGILSYGFFPISLSGLATLFIVGLLLSTVSAYYRSTSGHSQVLQSSIIFITIYLAGFLLAAIHQEKDVYSFDHFLEAKQNEFVAVITSPPKVGKSFTYEANITQMNGVDTRGKIILYVQKTTDQSPYEPGDALYIKSDIQSIPTVANPHSFDYKRFMHYKGYDFSAYIRDKEAHIIGRGELNQFRTYVINARKWSLSRLRKILKDDNHYAIASAMILGERSLITDELYTAYSETGSIHVLAVSGLHVGIISALFIFLLSFIENKNIKVKVSKLLFLLLVIWGYALITGMAPAVTRAAMMLSLFLMGKYFFRYQNTYNTLAAAAIIMLLYDPNLLYHVSFQFSFLALISIVFFTKRIYSRIATKYNVINRILQLASVSIAAQVLVFPLTIYYFHKFPVYFLLSGVVAVFLAMFIIYVGVVAIVLYSVPVVSTFLSCVLTILMETFVRSIYFIHHLPYGLWRDLSWDETTVILIYIIILSAMMIIKFGLKAKYLFTTMALIIVLQVYNIQNEIWRSSTLSLVVYSLGRDVSLIDLFKGTKRYSLSTSTLEEKNERYASEGNRIYHQALHYGEINLAYGSFNVGKEIVYLPSRNEDKYKFPAQSDVLILTDQYNKPPQYTLKYHKTNRVVADNTIQFNKRKLWKEYCTENQIAFYDIKTRGAFVYPN